MSQHLPPFPWLQAFEATARHLSFTRAAIELGITQAAVSHRIRNLEELLGAKLFLRDGNSVALTAAAYDFLASTRAVIDEMLLASDRINHHERGDVLTVACPEAFSIKCLIPVLPIFRKKYPDIRLKLRLFAPYRLHQRPDYDVGVQYGRGDWVGRAVEKVCSEEIFPVCSPALVRGPGRIRTPEDLRHHTIIRVVSPVIIRDEWPRWFEAAGYPNVRITNELYCDLLYPSFQAAIEGLGVVMGRSAVVKRDLEAGLLVEPFSVRLASESSYYVFMSEAAEREKRPIVTAFRDWLIETMNER